jgi:selenoprotein W-related protein
VNEEGLDITVEYCVPCTYLQRTMWMVNEVMSDIQEDVRSFTLVPSDNGRFEWSVNGELVYSKAQSGRFPELDELKQLVYAKM